MISNNADLIKNFPDKNMRDFYVMYHWVKSPKWFKRIKDDAGKVTFYGPGTRDTYDVPVQKVLAFEKSGIFINL